MDRDAFALEFLCESKAYWFATAGAEEARYLACYLNSGYANRAIKEFQSRGLFGPRDVHKKILELPLPRYDASQPAHVRLAALGAECAAKALEFLGEASGMDLDARALGRVRKEIRAALAEELREIDALAEALLGRKE